MNNKLLKYAGGVVALAIIAWVGLIVAFKVTIDPEQVRLKIESHIYDTTGYKAVIKRAGSSFWLSPKIVFYDVVVRNSKSQISPRVMSALVAEIDIDVMTIFDEMPKISNLTIEGFTLDIQELADGKYNIHAPKNKSGATNLFSLKNINLQRGRINYTPFGSDSTHEMRSINADVNFGKNIDIISDFEVNGHNYNFSADLKGSDLKGSDLTASDLRASDLRASDAKLSDAKISGVKGAGVKGAASQKTYKSILSLVKSDNSEEKIIYNGEVEINNGELMLNGEADFNLSNVNEWIHFLDLEGAQQKIYNVLHDFKLSGKVDIAYQNDNLHLQTKQAKLNQNVLDVDYEAKINDGWQFALKVDLAKINIKDDKKSFNSEKLYQILNKLLFKKINGDLTINIGEVQYNDTKFDKIMLEAALVGQELVLNNSIVKMAGDTDILLFGIARKDSGDLVNIDGSMEILGKDFQKFIAGLNIVHKEFTNGNEGVFRGKSNIFISQNLNLFSNIKFQVGNLFVEGNVENRPEKDVNYNITLNAKNATLDAFADYINPVANQDGIENGYDIPKFYIPWLESLGANYHLEVALQDFSLMDRNGNSAKFNMDILRNQIRFSGVDFNWQEMKVTGDLNITQSNQSPTIDCNLFVSEVNINDLIEGGFRRHPVERGNVISIWDDKPFDIDFMRGYDGNLNVNIGVVSHDSFTMRDVALQTVIEDGVWNIGEISGAIWGGELNAKGEIDVSSIFSADIDFLFKGIMVEDLLQSTLDIRPMQGKANIYGNVNTGGISVSNLVDSLKGQVILSGRDVSIIGFDIAGMLQTLPSVRNINDVANTVRVSLIRGKTSFSTMEGAFYFDRGVLKSHGIKLRSKHAIGTIKGQSNLVSWDMNYGLSFKLPTLSTMEVAEITLFFKESMDNPLVMVDSRDLESFMAKRKIGR